MRYSVYPGLISCCLHAIIPILVYEIFYLFVMNFAFYNIKISVKFKLECRSL